MQFVRLYRLLGKERHGRRKKRVAQKTRDEGWGQIPGRFGRRALA
jgi:hypothetical protein